MTYFRTDNTEGFSKEELNVMNEAFEILVNNLDDSITNQFGVKIIGDRLNNAFIRGKCDTVEQLIKAVR